MMEPIDENVVPDYMDTKITEKQLQISRRQLSSKLQTLDVRYVNT